MNIDTEKKIVSILSNIKGELLSNFNDEDALAFVEWSKKMLADTVKDRKEKLILQQKRIC